jgi:nucleoside-diphosphate-sugar epimerase
VTPADPDTVSRALSEGVTNVVLHLASLVDVNAALSDPRSAFPASVGTTLTMLEEIRRPAPGALVVVCSSDKVYGKQSSPFSEVMALNPTHPYEIAKATQDQFAPSYANIHGMRVAVTRCGNFFGSYDPHWERIIPYTIRQVLLGEPPALGSDGEFTRDLLYIKDAIAAHMLLAERLSPDPSVVGQAFNFSHEVELTFLRLVELIRRDDGIENVTDHRI